ncbi:hypothetical protein CWI39_0974p0010 [Hamiltosporidium magnivora]|uniref:Uncharacterized protein n=1 Tax=Hamiltosporidium magnivora TaxID=148818 RepID=A0A4Q9L6X9_9MICR|nr:hypothetical protein CWI39_0974p0010 [Hamiltosporidium magnivora]
MEYFLKNLALCVSNPLLINFKSKSNIVCVFGKTNFCLNKCVRPNNKVYKDKTFLPKVQNYKTRKNNRKNSNLQIEKSTPYPHRSRNLYENTKNNSPRQVKTRNQPAYTTNYRQDKDRIIKCVNCHSYNSLPPRPLANIPYDIITCLACNYPLYTQKGGIRRARMSTIADSEILEVPTKHGAKARRNYNERLYNNNNTIASDNRTINTTETSYRKKRGRNKIHDRGKPVSENTLLSMKQIELIVNGKSPVVQTKYVISYYTNIVANKINLYKLALENIIPGSSRLIVNMDFINNDTVEIISNENDEEALSYAFAKLPACKLSQSPEIDEKGTLWAQGLIERMRKIKDRQTNTNTRLRRLAIKIIQSSGKELQDVVRSLNILAKDVKEEFTPGYQQKPSYDI